MNQHVLDYHDYILGDVLDNDPDITSKKMFGGFGLYNQGIIFAIITSDSQLYFKADEQLAKLYADEGGQQFIYHGHKNKQATTMPYWTVPEHILENKQLLYTWIEQSSTLTKKPKS